MQTDFLSPLGPILHYPDDTYSFVDEDFTPDWLDKGTYCACVVGWCPPHECAVLLPLRRAEPVFSPLAIDDQGCTVHELGLAHRRIDSTRWSFDWQTSCEIERLSLEEGWIHYVLRAHTDTNERVVGDQQL